MEAGDSYLSDNAGNKDSWIAQKQMQLRKKWTQVKIDEIIFQNGTSTFYKFASLSLILKIQEKLGDKEQKLRIALADAEQLSAAMNAMNDWLTSAEAKLGRVEPISRILSTLQSQIVEQTNFEAEVTCDL